MASEGHGRHRREDFRFDARYGRLIRKAGIGTVPFALFYYQAELELTPQEVWLVAYVLSHRWTSELPFPAVREIARRGGITTKTIEKYKKAMVEKGYLQVVRRTRADGGNTSIGWDFSPLFERIDQLITRDIEHWMRRNPQFLEEELPALAGEDGYSTRDNVGDNAPPVLRASHGAVRQEYHGTRGQGYYGTVGQGSTDPGDRGRTAYEEDTERDDPSEPDTDEPGNDDKRPSRTARASTSKRGPSIAPHLDGPSGARAWAAVSALIDQVVRDYSVRLHDLPKSVTGNCTRARRLWRESGLSEDDFVGLLHEAYERTQANARRIRKAAKNAPYGTKNKMPYFFAVLTQLVEEAAGPDDGAEG